LIGIREAIVEALARIIFHVNARDADSFLLTRAGQDIQIPVLG
jgi:hypothetical protein